MNREEVLLQLRRFREQYQAQYHIVKIGIFGSAARGEMTEDSDLDIVVDLSQPDFFALAGIQQALAEQLQRQVDIVRYRQNMNQYLKRRIDTEAVYV